MVNKLKQFVRILPPDAKKEISVSRHEVVRSHLPPFNNGVCSSEGHDIPHQVNLLFLTLSGMPG